MAVNSFIAEINQTTNIEERQRLLGIIEDYPIEILPVEKVEETGLLAQNYLDNGIMPPKKLFDALHVALCVAFGSGKKKHTRT